MITVNMKDSYLLSCQCLLFLQETGYNFKVKGVDHLMYGAVAVGLGDTPGLNMFGGFKEGVAAALRICRHCMATLQELVNKVN